MCEGSCFGDVFSTRTETTSVIGKEILVINQRNAVGKSAPICLPSCRKLHLGYISFLMNFLCSKKGPEKYYILLLSHSEILGSLLVLFNSKVTVLSLNILIQ